MWHIRQRAPIPFLVMILDSFEEATFPRPDSTLLVNDTPWLQTMSGASVEHGVGLDSTSLVPGIQEDGDFYPERKTPASRLPISTLDMAHGWYGIEQCLPTYVPADIIFTRVTD